MPVHRNAIRLTLHGNRGAVPYAFWKETFLLNPIHRKLVIIFMVVLIFVGKEFSLADESEYLAFIKTVSGTSLTFGHKNICFLILEGSETNSISAEMMLILERIGAKLRTLRSNRCASQFDRYVPAGVLPPRLEGGLNDWITR